MENTKPDKMIKGYTFHIENSEFTLFIDEFHSGYSEFDVTHMHSFYEMFFLFEGCLKIFVDDQEICLKEGNVAIIPPRVHHRTVCEDKNAMPGIIDFVIRQNGLHTEQNLYERLVSILQKPYINQAYNQLIFELSQKCYAYAAQENRDMISVTFHEFVALILQLEEGGKNKISKEKPFFDSEEGRIHKINTFIYAHFREEVKIEDVATALYLSGRQVSRIIRTYYGCTFKELVTKNRMLLAAEALKKTTMTVEEVAEYVGYNSVCTFYQSFKKQFGMPPNMYRINNLENKI